METLDVTDWELEYDDTERDPDVLELEDEVQADKRLRSLRYWRKELQRVQDLYDEEKKEAKEEYFRERIKNTQLSYRIHACEIFDATGRKAFVAIRENGLLEWVDVTVHKTYSKMIDHFSKEGRVNLTYT